MTEASEAPGSVEGWAGGVLALEDYGTLAFESKLRVVDSVSSTRLFPARRCRVRVRVGSSRFSRKVSIFSALF